MQPSSRRVDSPVVSQATPMLAPGAPERADQVANVGKMLDKVDRSIKELHEKMADLEVESLQIDLKLKIRERNKHIFETLVVVGLVSSVIFSALLVLPLVLATPAGLLGLAVLTVTIPMGLVIGALTGTFMKIRDEDRGNEEMSKIKKSLKETHSKSDLKKLTRTDFTQLKKYFSPEETCTILKAKIASIVLPKVDSPEVSQVKPRLAAEAPEKADKVANVGEMLDMVDDYIKELKGQVNVLERDVLQKSLILKMFEKKRP